MAKKRDQSEKAQISTEVNKGGDRTENNQGGHSLKELEYDNHPDDDGYDTVIPWGTSYGSRED